ncbi:MAG: ABC transporter permease [Bacteroidia bacterium]|nr:ABC transporter permease [Bacteroidia bacterium]
MKKSVVRLIDIIYHIISKYKSEDYVFSKRVDSFFIDTHTIHLFITRFFKELFLKPSEFREIIRQCYEVGVKSIPLITLTGFVVGIVFTKQSRLPLTEFGAASWLPSLIGIAFVRALGPLVTALIAAGKVGSGIGAELASMKVTEQIDAMDVSAVNPFKFLVVTRVVATTVMIPILTLYCTFVGLLGSYTNVGVGKAANRAVVFSMFLIITEEIIVVQITHWINSF